MSGLFIRLPNANFTVPGLPVISTTEEERTLAALPGLRFWMDPQARFEHAGTEQGLRDRVSRYDGDDYSNNGYTLGADIGGQPTVALTNSPAQGLAWLNPADLAWMVNGYTVAAVVKMGAAATTQSVVFGLDSAGGTVRARISIRPDQAIEVRSDAVASAFTAGYAIDSAAHIIIADWDGQSGGASIEVDGAAQTLSAATLTAPLLTGATSYGIGTVPGVGFTNDVTFGNVMVFDRAYSRPENAAAKALLVSTLAAKYGIAI